MATTSHWYGTALEALLSGGLPINGSTKLTVLLVSSAYTPNADHVHVSDVTGELAGSGYARVPLTNVVASYNAATDTASFTADPASFASMTGTFRYLVLFDATSGSDATSQLLKWTDFGADQSVTAGTVTATPAATGLASITAS